MKLSGYIVPEYACQLLDVFISAVLYGYDLPIAQALLHQIWEPNETWTGLIHSITLQLQGRKTTQELQQSLINADHLPDVKLSTVAIAKYLP